MKNILTLLISIAFISCVNSNEVSFTKEFKVLTPLNMKISTSGGNVKVSGYNGDVVTVDFIVKKRGQVLNITLEQLKNIAEVDITTEKDILEIIVERIEEGISVGFDIKTPVNTTGIFKTSGGNVSASKLVGKQEIRTSGGNISLISISGGVEAYTSGGNISVKDQKGDIIVKTSGGNIGVENNDGKLEARTSGGNINISNSQFGVIAETSGGHIKLDNVKGEIEANTSGGGITMDAIEGSVNAHTSGGSIRADFVKLTGQLNLKTSGGGIDITMPEKQGLDLNLHGNRVHTKLENFSGMAEKDKVVGKMNGGGMPVIVSTSGGSVSLQFK